MPATSYEVEGSAPIRGAVPGSHEPLAATQAVAEMHESASIHVSGFFDQEDARPAQGLLSTRSSAPADDRDHVITTCGGVGMAGDLDEHLEEGLIDRPAVNLRC